MSSLTSSLQDLISSIFGVFRSIFATIFSTLESVTAVFTNLISGILDFARGLVGFLLSKFISCVLSPRADLIITRRESFIWLVREKEYDGPKRGARAQVQD